MCAALINLFQTLQKRKKLSRGLMSVDNAFFEVRHSLRPQTRNFQKTLIMCSYILVGSFFCTGAMANDNKIDEQSKPVLIPNTPSLVESAHPPIKKESSGKNIYERFCVVCHRDGLMGAPKFRDESQWDKRLSDRAIEDLVTSVIKGKNAMPAKGTCYECTDDDIKSAVAYMMPQHD